MRDDSHCPKATLCDFKVIGDYPDAQVEICVRCGKKVVYNKEITEFRGDENGQTVVVRGTRTDNHKYLRDHARDFLQPHGKTRKLFLQVYGPDPERELAASMKNRKSKDQVKKMWEETREKIQRLR